MVTRLPTLCDSCVHVRPANRYLAFRPPACNAFTDSIPEDIWYGGFDHRQPYEGDNGVTYDMTPGREDLLDMYLTRKELQDIGTTDEILDER